MNVVHVSSVVKRCFGYFMNNSDVEVYKVLAFEEQFTLQCGINAGANVQWFYQEQQDDTPVPIAQLGDTSYIVSPPYLYVTHIQPRHEGFYSCNQASTLYHLVVIGKWKGLSHDRTCFFPYLPNVCAHVYEST